MSPSTMLSKFQTAEQWHVMTKPAIMLAGLYLVVYIAPLGLRPIVVPDEARYAEIPREMIASHDWIVPRLNGLRYFEKPVLGYWVTAASMTVFGENAFAVRLPSALAVGLSSLLLFFMVRTFTGHYSVAVLAAAVYLTCLEVFGVGTFCVLDTLLSFFITGVMVTFFRASMEENPGKNRRILALCGILCGLGFLTKGFIAIAVPLVAIIPFLLWESRLRAFVQVCWLPILTAVVVTLPWAVIIHMREPDFWRFFLWNEHIRRFIGENAQHTEPFWYYVPVLAAAALPWTVLVSAAVSGLRQPNADNELVRFSLCWFLCPLLFLSLSRGKLLTYILPCFPPFAILMAVGLHHYSKVARQRAFTIGTLSLGTALAAGAAVLVLARVADPHYCSPWSKTWQWAIALIGICSSLVLLLLSCGTCAWSRRITLYVAASVPLMVAGPLLLPDRVVEHNTPGELLLRHAHRIQPDTILVTDNRVVHAVCWFYKRSDAFLFGGAGELDYGLGCDDATHRMLNHAQFKKVILEHHGSSLVTLIAKTKNYLDWKQHLPEPLFEDSSGDGGFVFVQY